MIETWYVLEDGSVAHPRDVKPDAKGVWRHKDGRGVAMRRPTTPRTRSVDLDEERAKAATAAENAATAAAAEKAAKAATSKSKDMKPTEPDLGYKTRETKAD
jgi:hypothetical protein